MLGRGAIAIKRADGKYDLHFVDPWSLSMAMHGIGDEVPKWNKQILESSKDWVPDAVVDAEELEKIKAADNCISTKAPNYHQYASDAIHVVEEPGHGS